MKTFVFILIGLIVLFLLSQAFVINATLDTEKHDYKVLKTYELFEIRRYEEANFSMVKVNANTYEESSGMGFRKLAAYIFGDNQKNQSIAMTSPVSMNFSDSTTMMFMIPSEYEIENLPQPNNKEIQFRKLPSRRMAAITFGGWANDQRIEEYTQQLKAALSEEGLKHKGNFNYLGYNSPYEMLNRRNEIVVEVEYSNN